MQTILQWSAEEGNQRRTSAHEPSFHSTNIAINLMLILLFLSFDILSINDSAIPKK